MKFTIQGHTQYSVDLPFSQRVNGHIIDRRFGILVQIQDQNQQSLEIEIAPFQGFLEVSLDQAYQQFLIDLERVEINDKLTFSEKVDQLARYNLAPSSFFGFLQIFDQKEDPLDANYQVCINSILSFDQFKNLDQENFSQCKVKIKIHRETPEEIIDSLKGFAAHTHLKYFRFDMNRAWNVEKLETLWELLKTNALSELIDYFEEPLEKYDDYKNLSPEIPIMHEECWLEYLKSPNQAEGLVYKPSQIPWPIPVPKRLVLSSCWEGPRGISALKRLSTLFPEEYHGLGASISYK